MINNSLLVQLITAGLAIAIIFTYIKPTLADIKQRQDDIARTLAERQTIVEVNNKLNELVAKVNDIPQSDKLALGVYMPDRVDDVATLKDLSQIALIADVSLQDLSYEGVAKDENGVAVDELGEPISAGFEKPVPHSFLFGFVGSYERVKQVLALMERNNYPLEVREMEIRSTDGGLLEAEIKLVTYAHKGEEPKE